MEMMCLETSQAVVVLTVVFYYYVNIISLIVEISGSREARCYISYIFGRQLTCFSTTDAPGVFMSIR